MGKLADEIRQNKPFVSPEVEAFLSLQRSADVLMRGLESLLKEHGLTQSQYNALRILRGAGEAGLVCRELGNRMVTRDPDITRLLDRLDARGLVSRTRDSRDRRTVVTRISPMGLAVLEALDVPVADLHNRQLAHLGPRRLRQLIELLDAVREFRRRSSP